MLQWFRKKFSADPEVQAAAPVSEDTPVPEESLAPLEEFSLPPDPSDVSGFSLPSAPSSAPSAIESLDSSPSPSIPHPASPVSRSFFSRLKEGLSRTKSAMVDSVRAAIGLKPRLDDELLEQIEDILIQADVGVPAARAIVGRLRADAPALAAASDPAAALLAAFKAALADILGSNNRPLAFDGPAPRILLFVGVNGTGKTTTIGKLGRELSLAGKRVMMVAADTFRAAAADQLQVWAERTGSAIVRQAEGADPAAVVYEALEGAKLEPPDVILIDTAGRLHTKLHLMEQLKKIRRIIEKHYPAAPHETILVLDATTGQNALNQLKTFNEATALTGLVMTKLDGTAKGGVLVACKAAAPLPVFKIGVGEQPQDLRDFNPADFVEALFE